MAEEFVDKLDASKPPMSFLGVLRGPLASVSRVLEYGNRKYKSITNYRHILDGERRYLDAAMRHLMARCDGEITDPESGEDHLAHVACCVLMALWFAQVQTTFAEQPRNACSPPSVKHWDPFENMWPPPVDQPFDGYRPPEGMLNGHGRTLVEQLEYDRNQGKTAIF